jgi:hypothetical protein
MRRRRRELGSVRAAGPDEINGGWVDRYTIAHFASGTLIRLLGKKQIPWWGALLLGIAWEVVERPLKEVFPGMFAPYDTQDSLQNSISDVVALMLGYGTVAAIDGTDEAWIPR